MLAFQPHWIYAVESKAPVSTFLQKNDYVNSQNLSTPSLFSFTAKLLMRDISFFLSPLPVLLSPLPLHWATPLKPQQLWPAPLGHMLTTLCLWPKGISVHQASHISPRIQTLQLLSWMWQSHLTLSISKNKTNNAPLSPVLFLCLHLSKWRYHGSPLV